MVMLSPSEESIAGRLQQITPPDNLELALLIEELKHAQRAEPYVTLHTNFHRNLRGVCGSNVYALPIYPGTPGCRW